MEEDIKKEELANKQRKHKIDILKREFEEISTNLQKYKEGTAKQLKDQETFLFKQAHTRDVLTDEKKIMFEKQLNLKNENQNKGREITKMRYHNNKDEVLKKRRGDIEKVTTDITKTVEEIETEQNILEAW